MLRWFDDLPKLERKHDLDLLVADHSMAAVCAELSLWPVGHPVDLYSVSGLDDSDCRVAGPAAKGEPRYPLFPAAIASGILKRRIRFKDLCYVPDAHDHFCALAYHATYIKGAASGLTAEAPTGEAAGPASHDYAATLRLLAGRAGIQLGNGVTRSQLDDLLAELGWRPGTTQLRQFAASAPWLQRKHFGEELSKSA